MSQLTRGGSTSHQTTLITFIQYG